MPKISIYFGGLLSLLALVSFTVSGFEQKTALIPLFIGAPIVLCGWLTLKQPAKAKIYMHIAVTLSLLGFLAAASRIPKLDEFGSIKSTSIWSMTVLCFMLTGLYVQSFIKARTQKEG